MNHLNLYASVNNKINQKIVDCLLPFMYLKKVKRKETLLKAGEICDHIFLIKKGAIKQYYVSEGKEFIQHFYFEGQMASKFNSFLTQDISNAYLEAIEGTELWVLNYHNFKALSEVDPHLNGQMSILMSDMHLKRVNLLLMSDGQMRYEKFLEQEPEMINRVPHYMIASYLGMTPETLSRIRRKIMQRVA